MIVSEEYIKQLEEYYRFRFTKKLKSALIDQLGEEPYPHEYSEQDIWEQSRRIIQSYLEKH